MTNSNQILVDILNHMEKQKLLHQDFLDVPEAAKYLNISCSALYKMTSGKTLPHYIPGGKKIYFKRKELDEWIESNKVDSIKEWSKNINGFINHNNK